MKKLKKSLTKKLRIKSIKNLKKINKKVQIRRKRMKKLLTISINLKIKKIRFKEIKIMTSKKIGKLI
jgi:hypothetical protein